MCVSPISSDLSIKIEQIYIHAGLALTLQWRARIHARDAANMMHKHGEFRYSLNKSGLDEVTVRQRIAPHFALLEKFYGNAATDRAPA